MNIDDSLDYKVNNFAPDMDVIQMEFGKHIDSCITVTVDRDENGQVNVIVVDKPVGIISHARGRFWQEASVASFVRNKIADNLSGDRAGIVHRLDRATSGLMICAKNEKRSLSNKRLSTGLLFTISANFLER